MKPTKEAICGVLAAIEERARLDLPSWTAWQQRKVDGFVKEVSGLSGVSVSAVADVSGMPFPRAHLRLDVGRARCDARRLVQALKAGVPSIWVMEHRLADAELILELVPLSMKRRSG